MSKANKARISKRHTAYKFCLFILALARNFINKKCNLRIPCTAKILSTGCPWLHEPSLYAVMGVSECAILDAIVAGQTDSVVTAELSKARLRIKRDELIQALEGRVRPHQRFILAEVLCQLDSLDETIARFDEEIQRYCDPFEHRLGN